VLRRLSAFRFPLSAFRFPLSAFRFPLIRQGGWLMDKVESIGAFFSRLLAHDEAAAQKLVDLYQPMLLDVAGRALPKRGLRRLLDPEDITQRVFQNFFTRVVPRRKVASWQELAKLLVAMTVNLVRDEWRHAHARRRTSGPPAQDESPLEARVDPGDDVGHELEIDEEVNRIHNLLSEQDWKLAWAWASGMTWPQLAAQVGENAGALRMRFTRVLASVRGQVDLDNSAEAPPAPKEPPGSGCCSALSAKVHGFSQIG
jgi:hypothetical protein